MTIKSPNKCSFSERQGNLTFRFEMYRGSTYATPHTSYPVYVTLNEDMYLRYSVESSADLVVMALNCKATNGSDSHSLPEYKIIQDGWVKLNTAYMILNIKQILKYNKELSQFFGYFRNGLPHL